MHPYLSLMRLDKPIGILLLLWPTLWALWLASNQHPDRGIVALFIIGVILMRSAGCVINDIFDQHLDSKVSRTRLRPLAAGTLTTHSALILFVLLILSAGSVLFFLNQKTRFLALGGALLAVIYPLLKRIIPLPQFGLGVAFAWGIPMAFAACQQPLSEAACWLFASAFFWIVMYDTLYAMVDRYDDLSAGIHSSAIFFGKNDRLMIFLLQLAALFCLLKTGLLFHLKTHYYICLASAGCLFAWQQWLIRDRHPHRCFQAFMNNHWVGLLIFLGLLRMPL